MSLCVGIREFSVLFNEKVQYTGPAGIRGLGEVVKAGQQIKQGEPDEAMLRSLNMAAGIWLHYPAVQVDRSVRGMYEVLNGEAETPVDAVKMMLFGPERELIK